MTIISRYLLKQHALPFVYALTALTSFELLRQIARRLEDLLGKGLPWTIILEFFALTLPVLVAVTLSMSVLVAVLYTVSHMASDRELTAMRAGGVSIGQLMRPLLVGATGVALVSFLFGDQILPRTNHRLRALMTDIARTKPTFSLKEHVINEVQRGRTSLRAARIDQSTYRLWDVTVYNMEDATELRIVYADSGRLAFAPNQEDLQLTLYDGSIHEYERMDLRMFQLTHFQQQTIILRGVGSEFARRDTDTFRGEREKSICQLEEDIVNARREGWIAESRALTGELNGLRGLVALPLLTPDTVPPPTRRSIYCGTLGGLGEWLMPAALQAQGPPRPRPVQDDTTRERLLRRFNEPARRAFVTGALPRTAMTEVQVLWDRARSARIRVASWDAERQKKYSIPAACVVFVLIGVPLGIRFPRGGMGLVIGGGMAVFSIYYVGLIAGETLADRMILPPFLAMWMANILMAAAGVIGLAWVRRAGTAPRRRLRRAPRRPSSAAVPG